jgi:hypothetical protein
MAKKTLYDSAHLFVAAIRVITHQNAAAPLVEQIAGLLSMSLEETNLIANKLLEKGIIESIESGAGSRLFIKNHLELENLPRDVQDNALAEELLKFQKSKDEFSKKIESIKAAQKEKKKSLYDEMEKKLKEEIEKKKKKS